VSRIVEVESYYFDPLVRAWGKLILDAANRGDNATARALSDFWSRNQYRALYHVRETIGALRAPPERDPPLSPEEWRELGEEMDKILDLRPPSKAGKDEIRPIWPMTIAQLRAQVEKELGPIKNPAPILLKEHASRSGSLYFGQRIPKRRTSMEDNLAAEGMAWKRSAPEGFPPIPRKGGRYSKHESSAITSWLRSHWPVMREAERIAAERDREMLSGVVDPNAFRRLNSRGQTSSNFTQWLNAGALDYRSFAGMDAEDKTPKELYQEMLKYAKNELLPDIDAIKSFDMGLFKRWKDPDAHMDALNANAITRGRQALFADELYGLHRWHADWMKPLVGKQATPAEYLIGTGGKEFKLSFLLAEQKKAEKAKEDKEAERKETLRRLAQNLAPLVGRNVNKAKLLAALPAGYRVEEMGLLVSLYGPGNTWLEGAREATVTKSYAELVRRIVES
jgi:hypothetical protein